MSADVIAFPTQFRVVTVETEPPRLNLPEPDQTVIIDHDGRAYDLTGLIRHLSPTELREVEAAMPRSAQALWDEVMRRWPALAAEIIAANKPTVWFAGH